MKQTGFILLVICAFPLLDATVMTAQRPLVAERFRQLTRASQWRRTAALPLRFNTHHPQGLVRIGETFYVSSVEVTQPTRRFAEPRNGLDRDPGAGVGHLFKFDAQGNLITDLPLGEGAMYHPGGMDYDGKFIWVSVAEYRPNSRSIIYRIDPAAMKAAEIFRYPDHIGGLVHAPETRTLHGVNWGSRGLYRWTLTPQGRVTNAGTPPEKLRRRNPSFYIDYQDCKYLGRGEMLCGGLSNYQAGKTGARFSLGGLELVDLAANRALHQLPLELWTESGLPMTQNPFWIEPTERGLRAYFLPEDRQSTLYVYEVDANLRE